jgi:hypothetical protein
VKPPDIALLTTHYTVSLTAASGRCCTERAGEACWVRLARSYGSGPEAFQAPNTTVGSAAFYTITAAGDPRVVQLALKFLF